LLKLKVKPWLRVKMVTLEDLSVKWSTDRMKVINTYECLYAQVAYCMDIELDLDVVMEKLYRVFDNYSSAYMAYVDELEMDIDKSCYTNKSSLRDSLNLDFINMNNKMRDAEKRVNIAKKLAYAVMKQDGSKENEDKKDEVKQVHKYDVGVSGADMAVFEVQKIQTKSANIDNEEDVDKEMFDDQTESKSEKVDGRFTNPNIIKITGQSKNCAEASKALLELVPITAEVSVPFEFHRFIIGQKGIGVREMMNKFDVNIRVPAQDAKSDVILISSVPSNVDSAKEELAEKVAEHRTAVFAKDVMMESDGVTKAHRFKGFTSRWHTKNLAKGRRKVTLSRIQYTRARHKGYDRKTEISKKIYRIGKGYKMKDRKLTLGSFLYHDKVKVPGLKKLEKMKPLEGSVRLRIAAQAPADSAQI